MEGKQGVRTAGKKVVCCYSKACAHLVELLMNGDVHVSIHFSMVKGPSQPLIVIIIIVVVVVVVVVCILHAIN